MSLVSERPTKRTCGPLNPRHDKAPAEAEARVGTAGFEPATP